MKLLIKLYFIIMKENYSLNTTTLTVLVFSTLLING